MLKGPNANAEQRINCDSCLDETPMGKGKKVPMAQSLTMIEFAPNVKAPKKRPEVAPLNI